MVLTSSPLRVDAALTEHLPAARSFPLPPRHRLRLWSWRAEAGRHGSGCDAITGCNPVVSGSVGEIMRKLAGLLGVVVAALTLASCVTSPPATEELAQRPAEQQRPAERQRPPQSSAEQQQLCNPGYYFCPGKIAGCCPNGWGCGSTSCIRPAARKPAVTRTCLPGYYFCPGEVSGCCPNGWGCASTHCVRPGRTRDL
jgi:hypothetical protein